ncbi:MAG: septal ring lytic transglycosylase RlpA family protein [Terriglobia bacterium]
MGWQSLKTLLRRAGAIACLLTLLTGCHHRGHVIMRLPTAPGAPTARAGAPTVPVTESDLRGLASWYGYPYQGRATADGEIYNMYAMTAAHRTLPFNTHVRVHDLDNGNSVDVRINDRGPFIRGRIIDLSYAAAKTVGMVGSGTAHVQLEILNPDVVYGPRATPGVYAVQVGAFKDQNNAARLKALIEPHFGPVLIQTYNSPQEGLLYRVRVGNLNNEATAEALASDLKHAGLVAETYVVRLN